MPVSTAAFPTTMPQLGGLHHLTAVTANAALNRKFYTEVLGLRLVKKTVNQDQTTAYHLFYADGLASPGSDITFFDFPTGPEARGTHSIVRTALRVAGEGALGWWRDRLKHAGVLTGEPIERAGRLSLLFEDPEGQRLELVDDGGIGDAHPWERSPVPMERQIRGLGPITMSVPRLGQTEQLLTAAMGMRRLRDEPDREQPAVRRHVFAMGAGGAGAELHVVEEPGAPIAEQGAGSVHHVAFRVADRAELTAWTNHVTELGIRNSGEVERYYFRSLYFREPNGVLFELATDRPGFAVDEPLASLGERLSLPPFLEARRVQIEANLKPL
jgi:glyoxalase family protein